jgi:Transposase DDE domain
VVDKSKREDGTFSREDFTFDKERNVYICPASKILTTTGKVATDGETLYYRARTRDCRSCLLKSQCCPKAPLRRNQRSIYEEARDVARALAKTEAFEQSRRDRKRVEMLFAISSASFGSVVCACAGRAVLSSSSRWRPSRKTSAGSQSLSYDHRRSQKRASYKACRVRQRWRQPIPLLKKRDGTCLTQETHASCNDLVIADFCNKIGQQET